jgi:hypothetical protein
MNARDFNRVLTQLRRLPISPVGCGSQGTIRHRPARPEERQLAHVCLALSHFQDRREEEDLLAFKKHCRAAVDLGHAGTFCYERLAALYEYRGDRSWKEVLEASGDARFAEWFSRRLEHPSGGTFG